MGPIHLDKFVLEIFVLIAQGGCDAFQTPLFFAFSFVLLGA